MIELNVENIQLKTGAHKDREQGMCLLEAVAWFAGEPHSDHPACTDVVLAGFGRSFNDLLSDDERQLLTPLIQPLVGTKGSPDLAKRRAFLLVDRYLRVNLPALFRELPNKPRVDLAERFEALAPIVDQASAESACDLAREIRSDSRKPPYAAAAYAAAGAYVSAAYVSAAYAYAAASAYVSAAGAYVSAAYKDLRRHSIKRSIAAFEEAIALK